MSNDAELYTVAENFKTHIGHNAMYCPEPMIFKSGKIERVTIDVKAHVVWLWIDTQDDEDKPKRALLDRVHCNDLMVCNTCNEAGQEEIL